MEWTASAAMSVAARWKPQRSQMTTYKREGKLPNYKALYSPPTYRQKKALNILLNLAEDKYLKGIPMSRMIGRTDSMIAQAIASRKGTIDQTVSLYREDIDTMTKQILRPLKAKIPALLRQWKETEVDVMYSRELQDELVKVLNTPCINLMRLTMGLSHHQHNRVAAVVSGRQKWFRNLADKPLLTAVLYNLKDMHSQIQSL
jgi:hypothetical protein